ncbi:CysB family HTH-type transcriptional regulator [Oceanisphaera sp. W20_SRM_FM3]|uniref:CysB family HTH-type transcriptional regulator n=1 Tax=Oceanisphaera sp. W20_SRM_FM3 TaxID=3240267 RepID=UPI003F9700AB
MNLQQLRIVRETARRQFNLTAVSAALFTSQSGVSKHLRDLEEELGVTLFERRGKRLLGLTEAGEIVLGSVERIMAELDNMRHAADQFVHSDSGSLRIATTHTQARYRLPALLKQFQQSFPKVKLVLHQCGPDEIVELLKAGEVDVGIATEGLLANSRHFACFPYYDWHHSVVVPDTHPLCQLTSLTLADIAAYPVITYHEGYTGRNNIDEAFRQADIELEIAMSALDADVIKTYVDLELGIGILASMAFDERRDVGLTLLDGGHLFPNNTTYLGVRRGAYLRSYVYDFLSLCSHGLKRESIDEAIFGVVE